MPALPANLLDAPLAIVDLETTGTNAIHDRITEIAVIEVANGEVTEEWSTLVDPGTPIPAAIQALTGITNDMVRHAPGFESLAESLHERLDGRVIVAHNARFDYGFLRAAFERAGIRFDARTLCTVKLSRKLYSAYTRHDLSSLISRHRLECRDRHRALGDADAVWQFLRSAMIDHGGEMLAAAMRQVAKQPSLPPHLDRAAIDAVPEAPGVYLFYGEGGTPLYVGKSIAMRSRVLSHFAEDIRSPKEMQLSREVRRIEFERTAGELGALLRESVLVKELAPVFNRKLRRPNGLWGFALSPLRDAAANPAHYLRLVAADELDAALVPELRGVFRSRRAALDALREIADEHRLCLQTLGFESARTGRTACFRRQVRRCAGLCAGEEAVEIHHARLAAALARLESCEWPWPGPVGIVEESADGGSRDVHVVHHWCWLGTARSDHDLAQILEHPPRPVFDLDQRRILSRQLAKGRLKIVPLVSGRDHGLEAAA